MHAIKSRTVTVLTLVTLVLLSLIFRDRLQGRWSSPVAPVAPGAAAGAAGVQLGGIETGNVGLLTLAERYPRNEQLWLASVHDRDEMQKTFDSNREVTANIYPYMIWDLFRPSFSCPTELERIGTLGDGGKYVCGIRHYEREHPGPASAANPAPPLIIYSFGVNDDSSFEASMLERTNAEIWGFDMTVDSWAKEIPHGHSRAHFDKIAIGKKTDLTSSPQVLAIADIMKRNKHEFVDIMKVDIEGAEFEALDSFLDAIEAQSGRNSVIPVGQMLIEIHAMGPRMDFWTPQDVISFRKWWERLEKLGMRPVMNEHNWVGDFENGKPQFVEYTLINAKYRGQYFL